MENNTSQNNEINLNQTANRKFSFNYRFIILIAGIVAFVFLADKGGVFKNFSGPNNPANILSSAITPARAEEIYPIFMCPCCGQPLDPKNICCGMAKERIDYIDSLIQNSSSEKEIILAYVKKYGLNSFVDKKKQEEFKNELEKTAPAERPIITLEPVSKDLGNISQKAGVTATIFELKNAGKSDLIIDKLETSCGCTSVSVVFRDKEGPRFAMPGHGIENPTDWQITIPAGEKAELKIYYDPDVHKDFRGAATREIYIFSNDPVNLEKSVRIDLNQVD